jgi:hypothetical protein
MKDSTDEIVQYVKGLLNDLDASFLSLGDILREAQDNDPELFKKLLKLPGLDRRTGYYLASLSRTFSKVIVEKKDLLIVGWTKLVTIEKYVTQETVYGLVSAAKTHTNHELKELMAGKKPRGKSRVVLLYLVPKDYEKYRTALLKFGAYPFGIGLGAQEAALMKLIAAVPKKAG